MALSTEFDEAWELDGMRLGSPIRSFGWATAFEDAPADVRVRYGSQFPRTVAMIVLAALWAAALWITRKPVAR